MSTLGTYVLTDAKTRKFYVGSSKDIEKRIERHIRDLNMEEHHCLPLQSLWNKHSRLIETVFPTETREEAYELEQDLINRNLDSPSLLNVGMGVRGGDNLTRNPEREAILEKIRASLKTTIALMTPLERKLLYGKNGAANGMFGRTHSEETRRKISEINSRPENASRSKKRLAALVKTSDYRQKCSARAKLRTGEKNTFFGKHHTDDTKAILREKCKGILPPTLRPVVIDGNRYLYLTDASRKLGISPALLVYRLQSAKEKYSSYQYLTKSPTTIENAQRIVSGGE